MKKGFPLLIYTKRPTGAVIIRLARQRGLGVAPRRRRKPPKIFFGVENLSPAGSRTFCPLQEKSPTENALSQQETFSDRERSSQNFFSGRNAREPGSTKCMCGTKRLRRTVCPRTRGQTGFPRSKVFWNSASGGQQSSPSLYIFSPLATLKLSPGILKKSQNFLLHFLKKRL